MQIQVNTGKSIEGGERLSLHVQTLLETKLGRFREHITRVEAHLSDENAHKSGGNDKKCVMEARPEGRPPVAVTHFAANVDQAIKGAADKLEHLLDSTFGQINSRKVRTSPVQEATE